MRVSTFCSYTCMDVELRTMKKYCAIINLHPGILDNAGMATTRALASIGFDCVVDTRIGKVLYFTAESEEQAHRVASSQTNEVMETYELTVVS